MTDIQKENDKLRALLAWGNDPCIYCGLPSAEMSKCRSGFPGCARSDDMQADWSLEGWTVALEKAVKADRAAQETRAAVSDDQPCTTCKGTGWDSQLEKRCDCV